MDKLIAHVLEFNGDDEVSTTDDIIEPIVYADGSIELRVELVGGKKDRAVYVRFPVADLVRIATTAERNE